ncbi:hypothetical protein OIU74_024973 [Salix koriyanagi]|uniref:Uncharacterized protein n=1 Tax=Salix koriyanagi TaxID=2511006 RepID=A0A9Q1A925_9ROSI|nr:hypothetical protein OIU74_024973 [Salix koriyanagi]
MVEDHNMEVFPHMELVAGVHIAMPLSTMRAAKIRKIPGATKAALDQNWRGVQFLPAAKAAAAAAGGHEKEMLLQASAAARI